MSEVDSRNAVIVAGGARGIGAKVALQVARGGAPVAVVYRSRDDEAAEVLKQIEQEGGRAIAIRADLGVESEILRLFEEVDKAFGQLGGLVYSAATAGGRARVAEVTREQLEETLAVNVTGAFLCCREAVNRMSTANGGQGGSIVNISSIAARTGSPNVWVHYAASKAALETMSLGLAKETAKEGIRVNVARCGVIDTGIHAGHGEDRLKMLLAQVPMGRMGSPEEAADVVEYLLSPQASYVTGAVVEVGGGM